MCGRPPRLQLPELFGRLHSEQRTGALTALKRVEADLRQPVLDELATRCHSSAIRKPAGYLFGIIQKAMREEFRAWASERGIPRSKPVGAPTASEKSTAATSERSEVAQRNIAKLRAALRDSLEDTAQRPSRQSSTP